MNTEVFIQTCPQRRDVLRECLESVERSDVGRRYTVLENPSQVERDRFYLWVLAIMAESSREWVVRLEDDVYVNEHILHNAETWPALERDDFGVGWLHVPGAIYDDTDVLTGEPPYLRRTNSVIYGYAASVMRTETLRRVLERVETNLTHAPRNWEGSLSRALYGIGKYVYLHDPSLVEHRVDVPSTFGTKKLRSYHHSSAHRFDPTWKRT